MAGFRVEHGLEHGAVEMVRVRVRAPVQQTARNRCRGGAFEHRCVAIVGDQQHRLAVDSPVLHRIDHGLHGRSSVGGKERESDRHERSIAHQAIIAPPWPRAR